MLTLAEAIQSKRLREFIEQEQAKGLTPTELAALEKLATSAKDTNNTHREDFNALLRAAVKKRERED